MAPHAVLKNWHPMIGLDFHICVPPPVGPPIPWTPYVTGMVLNGTAGFVLTVKYCPTHFSAGWGLTMARGTDIGPMIPHLGPPSVPMAIEFLFSASKSHFGPRSYVEKDNKGDNNHVAAALVENINPNLNCGTPCPTPTGLVIAMNTHGVGMTWGDIIAGAAQMAIDAAVQTALFYIGNGIGSGFGKIAGRFGPQALSRTAARQAARAAGNKALGQAAKQLRADQLAKITKWNSGIGRGVSVLVNIFGGGPMGADAGAVDGPTGFSLVPKIVSSGGDALADYIDGGPPPANKGSAPIVPVNPFPQGS